MAKKNLPQRLRPEGPGTVLLALSDEAERNQAAEWLAETGYDVVVAADADDACRLIERRLDLDVVIAAHALAAAGVSEAVRTAPAGLALILAGQADVFVVTQGIASGAASFLPHPLTHTDLLSQVLVARYQAQEQVRKLTALTVPTEVRYEGIIGTTPRMQDVMSIVRKAAPTDASVVILGETGTGKELIAQAIHNSSPRAKGPFVALHLFAMPTGLIESELFGHKKGAYTDAKFDRVGKLEQADGGTLFLDELGDIPLETQVKLLRVLETRSFEPLGGSRPVSSDFRLVAATNQNIEQMIADKQFRPELWQRLKVVRLELPPLRERRADIPLLADQFLKEVAARYRKPVEGFEREALNALSRYGWEAGNIRELKNVIEHMVVLAEHKTLSLSDVPREILGDVLPTSTGPEGAALAGRTMDDIERDAIRQTLEMTSGNRKQAADLLQIGERTLYRKIEKYDL